MARYIFTVTAGRSGQASLTDLVRRCATGVVAAWEEPQIKPFLPALFGTFERRLRRRWVETHELLGRGDVLRAFVERDLIALERYARRRLAWIDRYRGNSPIYFDVSKYFIRGLHRPLTALVGRPRLVFLVRDPILNMKSFMNRRKNFFLDNNRSEQSCNELILTGQQSNPTYMYFWAWTEGYLRGIRLAEEYRLDEPIVIWTRELTDSLAMGRHFKALDIPFESIKTAPPINTNKSHGLGHTVIAEEDVAAFEQWRTLIPDAKWARLNFMRDYDPRALLAAEQRGVS